VIKEGVLFRPYLLADKPIVDIAFIQEDTIKRDFFISIANKEDHAVYPKLICNIPNWSFEGASYKELGELGAGAEKYYKLCFTRPKPTPEYGTDLVDSGNLRLEIYNDADYTEYYGAYDLPVDMRVVYMTAFPHVQQWSFYDGTEQGWTLNNMEISDARPFGVTKYCPRHYRTSVGTADAYISRLVTLPNTTKVFVKAQIYIYLRARGYTYHSRVSLRRIWVAFGDAVVAELPERDWIYKHDLYGGAVSINLGWITYTADLSDFRGQEGVLTIGVRGGASHDDGGEVTREICIDLPVIAGK